MSKPTLEQKYKEMADLTAPECANVCRLPHSCCDMLYCYEAQAWASGEYGIELEFTDHPKLPFMGENGCTVPPHLRPVCTLHTCDVNSIGCKRGDPDWTERYHKLRDEIDALEFERMRERHHGTV